jgi:TolB-like protein/DNA-binding winged helix-turn-helix (wHTH) protein/lipoprotein NlpI
MSHDEITHCEPMVFDLIVYLIENHNNLISRDELLAKLWPGREVCDATLSNHIKSARKLLGDDGQQQKIIETVRGRGYRFIASPLKRVESNQSKLPLLLPDVKVAKSLPPNHIYRYMAFFLPLILAYFMVEKVLDKTSKPIDDYQKTTRIAVLPFSNTLNDIETDYLGFAVADQIIGDLVYFKRISVRPSSEIRKYIGQILDINEVAKTLNVDYVLSGNYIADHKNIRFHVELIQSRTGQLIWRKAFDVGASDIFKLQESISHLVSEQLEIQLAPNTMQRLMKSTPKNALAYELYLKSRAQPTSHDGHNNAIKLLERALQLDADYAPIYTELGFRHHHLALYSLGSTVDAQRAMNYILKALAMNGEILEAYTILASIYTETGQIEKAIENIKMALKINPNYADAHFFLGYAYRYAGMIQASVKSMETALTLDPNNPRFRSIGVSYFFNGNYDKALQGFDLDAQSAWANNWRGLLYNRLGEYQHALDNFNQARQKEPNGLFAKAAMVFKAIINKDFANGLAVMDDLASYDTPDGEVWYHWSANYAALGDHKTSVRLLKKAMESGYFNYPTMNKDPYFDSIRANPQFKKIMLQIKEKHLKFKQKYFDSL